MLIGFVHALLSALGSVFGAGLRILILDEMLQPRSRRRSSACVEHYATFYIYYSFSRMSRLARTFAMPRHFSRRHIYTF